MRDPEVRTRAGCYHVAIRLPSEPPPDVLFFSSVHNVRLATCNVQRTECSESGQPRPGGCAESACCWLTSSATAGCSGGGTHQRLLIGTEKRTAPQRATSAISIVSTTGARFLRQPQWATAIARYRKTANRKTCFIVLRAGALSEPALQAAMWHGSPTMDMYIIDVYCIR